MEEKIMALVEERHKQSGGSCGLSFLELLKALQLNYDDHFKATLSMMHKAKQIRVRKGINGYLIMKPKNN